MRSGGAGTGRNMNERSANKDVPFNDVGWMWDECCICGKVVLGLVGQDQRLDRFLLDPDDDALRAGVVGRAHTACLIRSEWGRHWNRLRRKRFLSGGRFAEIVDGERYSAFRDERASETHLLYRDGGYDVAADHDLKGGERTRNGWLFPVRERAAWNFRDHALVSADAWAVLRRDGRHPLETLLRDLHILDALLLPEAVRGGEVRYLPDEDGPDANVIPTAGLTAEVVYRRFLPDFVVPALPAFLG